MQFKPKLDLLKYYDEVEQKGFNNPPYVAIYRSGNKTLVYMADRHAKEVSWNMVDWCFSKKFGLRPDILLTEFENVGRKFDDPVLIEAKAELNTLAHAAFVAAKHKVPVVLSDLSASEMMSVIGIKEKRDLHEVLRVSPNSNGSDLQKMGAKLNKEGRNPFMVQNIAAALNKYDTVFCIFGEGHFREQRAVLDDMFGKEPDEFITEFPDMHTDFGKSKRNIFQKASDIVKSKMHKMEIIRLVEFGKGKEEK